MKLRSPNLFRNVPALVIGYRRPDAIAKVLRSVRANLSGPVYVFVDRPREIRILTSARMLSLLPGLSFRTLIFFAPRNIEVANWALSRQSVHFLTRPNADSFSRMIAFPRPGFFHSSELTYLMHPDFLTSTTL